MLGAVYFRSTSRGLRGGGRTLEAGEHRVSPGKSGPEEAGPGGRESEPTRASQATVLTKCPGSGVRPTRASELCFQLWALGQGT